MPMEPQMLILNELACRFSAGLGLQAILDAVVAATAELFPRALAEISLWDKQSQRREGSGKTRRTWRGCGGMKML